MTLGERLKKARGSITALEFARMCELHPNTLCRYEKGERLPDADFLIKVCELRRINPSWLLLGQGGMRTSPLHNEGAEEGLIDIKLMEEAVRVVETIAKKKGLKFSPEQKAKAIMLLYQMYGDMDEDAKERFQEEKILRIIAA